MKKYWERIKIAIDHWFNRQAGLRSCIVHHETVTSVYDDNGVRRVRIGAW